MHEFSIVDSLVGQIRSTMRENGLVNISLVEIEAGELRQVIPEVMHFAFEQSIAGTELEGARLTITVREASADCRSCGITFHPKINDFRCPQCGVADADVTQGEHILLTSLTAHEDALKEPSS